MNRTEIIHYIADHLKLAECRRPTRTEFGIDADDYELLTEVYQEAVFLADNLPDVRARAVAAFNRAGWPVR